MYMLLLCTYMDFSDVRLDMDAAIFPFSPLELKFLQ